MPVLVVDYIYIYIYIYGGEASALEYFLYLSYLEVWLDFAEIFLTVQL